MSNSFHEHAITVPPTRYESAYTISIGDIEIVNWQRAKSLEEIETELPDSFEQKLASKYVRSVLREKTSQRPDLNKLRENILHRLSNMKTSLCSGLFNISESTIKLIDNKLLFLTTLS